MLAYDPALYSRILTGVTLGFHIIFATIGVGIPVMIAIAEFLGIKRKDPYYTLLARRWTRGFVITVAVGVVTGTSIGLQLNLLWPSFMQIAGQAIALPLFMETFAFFFEAIFLGIYLYTWDRFKNPWIHFSLSIPVVIGSTASAFFITIVNAFMNAPQGFKILGNTITEIDPLVAMFNPATPTKTAHVIASAYMTSAFVLAAIAAAALLAGKRHIYYHKALKLTMICGLVFSLSTAVIGDLSGKYLAKYQPEKLAAAEWHFETTDNAPLIFGGILDENNEIRYGLKLPYALSILATGSPNGVVKGLNEVPPDLRPPLIVHYFFDIMVAIGSLTILLAVVYLLLNRKSRRAPGRELPRWLLRCIVWSGPLSIIAIECGWLYAELGRQPWILRGYMRTVQGATTSAHVDWMLILFSLLYMVLGFSVVKILRGMFRSNTPEQEIEQRGIEGGRIG
ncbi:cytochrome ubiquinol oxidase subunit I [Paenibacillus xerothermodurans]|uniref:Cytochrome ubiquinol oxidase subunit I n=1 Tax=Paenibacillus xerothermodurans TaxID=1977292 RepID=A0A2W1P168_PAEXE|nr:cytochrome ubiquinol oxidase subunit I [Paenibacillus xerothermodurans]PZE21482.1 cytochrome ubiquinol oxidase subunit I [Paenibacillus xerothermodurans]